MKIVKVPATVVETDNFCYFDEWKAMIDQMFDSMADGLSLQTHIEIMEYLRTKTAYEQDDLLKLNKEPRNTK